MKSNLMIAHLRYNQWATARLLEAAKPLTNEEFKRDLRSSHGSVHGTLVHIYQADQIWFARLMGHETGLLSAYQPPDDLEAFQQDWLGIHELYLEWSDDLTPDGWTQEIGYRNTKGEPFRTPAWQIVLHVVNHATYHRGQVAGMLRQLGHAPPGTDLITYYRSMHAHAGR